MRLYLSILFFFILLHATTFAENKHNHYKKFENLNVLHGLSNNNVLDIVQDKSGFIWVATEDGLNRYDGYKFRVFKHIINDSTSLKSNYITSLCLDSEGKLWVGTKDGLYEYHPLSESFKMFPVLSEKQNGISDASIRKVYNSGKDAILWVETIDGTLNRIDLNTQVVSHYKHKKIPTNIYDYHSIFQDSKGDIYLGGRDMGPFKFDTLQRKLYLIKADYFNPEKKRDQDVACVFQSSNGRYWMSATDGFYEYFPKTDKFKKWLNISTYSIIEGSKNELWLATGSGLVLFNNVEEDFTYFQYNQNNKNSIAHNRLNCVFKDKNDNLWIGSRKGISVLLTRENFFTHYYNIPETESSLSANKVSSFLEDKKGNIWIGTMDGGINKWDRASDQFKNFKNGFGNQKVSCFFEDSYQNLWIGLWSGTGFYKLDSNRLEFTKYTYNSLNTKSDWYNAFFEDHRNRFWVGFWGATGIQMFNRATGNFEPYGLNLLEAPMRKPLKFVEATDSFIWCPNYYHYIHRYNLNTNYYEAFVNVDSNFVLPEWRNNNRLNRTAYKKFHIIYSSLKLPNNEVAFATNNGLIIHKNYKANHIENNMLNNVTAMTYAHDNIVLANNKYLVWFNLKAGSVVKKLLLNDLSSTIQFPINAIALVNNKLILGCKNGLYQLENDSLCAKIIDDYEEFASEVKDIKTAANNNLWIATENGVKLIDKQFRAQYSINKKGYFNKGLVSDNINCIYVGSKAIWFGTNKGFYQFILSDSSLHTIQELNNIVINKIADQGKILWLASEEGLVKYNTELQTTEFMYKKSNHQLSSRLTQFIQQDSKGNIWIGTTQNGLNFIDTSTFEIQHYLSDMNDSLSLWGDHTTCMLERKNGDIIIGAEGLNYFNYTAKKFAHVTIDNGLISNTILGLAEDNNENVWVLTNKGLMRIGKENNIDVFNEDWGLLPHEFNIAMYTLKSGEILLGSDNGFYAFNPLWVDSVKFSKNIEITGFKIFNNTVKTDFTNSNTVNLDYNQNFFTFEFSDLNFAAKKNNYLYKLTGVDKNWVNSNYLNFASYTKIPHGKYLFQVTTPRNLKNGIPARKINLIIHPPFWKTIWFILLEILTGIAVLLYLYYQRIKKFKLREKHLQLEQKLLRSQMNPHFVFNALIAIQSFIFKNNAREAGRYLSKFAKLMRLFLQNTRQEFIPLSQELETIEYYMQMQCLRLNDSFEFNIVCDETIDADLIEIPPMMAQPFIENAIEHGFKGIHTKGLITVAYELTREAILIEITDNGKGIIQSQNEKTDSTHKSLATTITRERLASYSNKHYTFKLTISDLSVGKSKQSGTKVCISVPFKEKF